MSSTPRHESHATHVSHIDEHEKNDLDVLRKFLPLIRTSRDIYFIVDSVDNRFVYINNAIVETLGFSLDEAIALQPKAFVTNASMDTICDAIPRAIAAHGSDDGSEVALPPLHVQLIAKDRTRIPAELSLTVSLNRDHTVQQIAGVVRSTVFTRQSREKSGDFERLLGELFYSLPIGCIVCSPKVDSDGFILQACNRAAEKMTGITIESAVGKDAAGQLPELHGNDVLQVMKSVAQSGIAVKLPVVFHHAEKGEVCREYTICRISGGSVVTLFCDTGNFRQQLDDAKGAIESLQVVTGSVLHDLNNVAGLLFGQLDLVLSTIDPNSEITKRLQPAMQAFDRMRDCTGRLSILSRKSPPQKSITDMGELLHSTAARVFRSTGIEYTVTSDSGPMEIPVDACMLANAFTFILENSRNAMDGRGNVTITFRKSKSSLPEEEATSATVVTITITDTGRGIPMEQRPKLFKPVFSEEGKEKKVRKGLAVAKSIIIRHGGTISVDSETGKGTTVTIQLPAENETGDAAGNNNVKAAAPSTGPGRVLIMDDEEILLDIAIQMCRRIGLEVTSVPNSHEAVEKYRQEFREGTPFDLVMLDLTIPGGRGGLETAVELKKIDPEVKTIAMSGYTDHEVMANPSKFGFTAILNKPFRLSDFSTVLKSLLPADKFRTA